MPDEFQPIKLTGIDENQTHCPDPDRPAMLEVYFTLSSTPPAEWADSFNARWQTYIYSMKRRAKVSGSNIVMHCAVKEIAKYHKAELMKVIGETNADFQKYFEAQKSKAGQDDAKKKAQDEEIKNAISEIEFE